MKTQTALPVGVAAFVGRESERAKVADLVVNARVVTLTGAVKSGLGAAPHRRVVGHGRSFGS